MKNSKPVNIPTTTACTAKNLSGKAPLFRATAKRFALVVLSVLSLSLLATACKQDPATQPNPQQEGVPMTITLNLPVPTLADALDPSASQTKAAAEVTTAEQLVQDVWVVQYNGINCVGFSYASGTNIRQSDNTVSINCTGIAGSSQTFYFLVNTHDPALLSSANTANPTTLAAVTQAISAEFRPDQGSGLPMWGSVTAPTVTNSTTISANVDRLVAKIKLRFKNNVSGLTIASVQLRNIAASIGYKAAPATGSTFPATAANSHIDYPAEDPATAGTDGDYKTFVWYVPENLRQPNSSVLTTLAIGDRILANTNDQMATYIEISGSTTKQTFTYSLLLGDLTTSANDFNVLRNSVYTMTFDLNGLNAADHRITTSGLQANSFMVTPGGSVTFDAGLRGNEVEASLNPQSVVILWQDNANLLRAANVAYNSGTRVCTITPAAGQSGNALVAAYDGATGNGTILWSWHIWVTDYKPSEAGVAVRTVNTAYTVTGGEVHTYGTSFLAANGASRTIMDRNLGATKGFTSTSPTTPAEAVGTYGYLYQWGRKDPFPSATCVTNSTTSIPLYNATGVVIPAAQAPSTPWNTLAASPVDGIRNPTTIYSGTATAQDWLSIPDNNLWKLEVKTLDDPCPKGWRVPPYGTWVDFNRTNATAGTFLWYNSGALNGGTEDAGAENGRCYLSGSTKAWYPATGQRNYTDGELSGVGSSGASRSSSTLLSSSSQSSSLVFLSAYVASSSSQEIGRATGISVRCIQE